MCKDGRGLKSKLVSFTKGFSKQPHILAIFEVDSEYLRFPFKAKVDYFILYSILVYSFVILLIFLLWTKKMHVRSRTVLSLECSSVNKWTTAYQHVISRASPISVSIKGAFWYLSLFFLEWSTINFCYSSRFVSLDFTIRTVRTQKNSLRFLFFLPLSCY